MAFNTEITVCTIHGQMRDCPLKCRSKFTESSSFFSVCNLTENPVFITCNTIRFYQARYQAFKRLRRATNQYIFKQDAQRKDSMNTLKRHQEDEEANEAFSESVFSEFGEEELEDLLTITRNKKGIKIRPTKRLKVKRYFLEFIPLSQLQYKGICMQFVNLSHLLWVVLSASSIEAHASRDHFFCHWTFINCGVA